MSDVLAKYKIRFYAIVNVVLLFLALTSGRASLALAGIFGVVLILFLWMEKEFRPNITDVIIILLFVYELILGNSSIGRNNSLSPILAQFTFTAYYFIVRLSLRYRLAARLSLRLTSILFIVISLFCIVSFLIFQKYTSGAGINNLYDFKFLYRPLGNLNNVWATFLLIFLLIYLLYALFYGARKKLTVWLILSVPLLYCIIVSFSRGIYICMGVVLAVLLVSLIASRKFGTGYKIAVVSGAVLILAAIAFLHKDEVLRTVRINETVSQQRSLGVRISSLKYLGPAMSESPFLGVGTGNYSLAMDGFLYQDDDHTFTGFAPNIVSQLLVEKGLVGLGLWVVLGVCLLISLRHSRKDLRREQLFILFAIAVIFLRELSFSSLLTTLGLQIMLAFLLGFYINNLNTVRNYSHNRRWRKVIFSIVILGTFIYCSLLNLRYDDHAANIESFKACIEEGRYEDAKRHLDKCRRTAPTFIYYSELYKKRYLADENGDDLDSARLWLSKAIETSPQDIKLKYDQARLLYLSGEKQTAKSMLEQLYSKYPNNYLAHALLGNIIYLEGDKHGACTHLARAIELVPSVLETRWWEDFGQNDSLSSKMIRDIWKNDVCSIGNDPIKLAKFGKIFYLAEDYGQARELLTEALRGLPNLQEPWVYLWKIASTRDEKEAEEYLKKAELLGFNKDKEGREERTSEIFAGTKFPIYPELTTPYVLKFQKWYETEWYPEVIVF